jgi:glycerophosphoryl diester phosphodiesterase
MKIRQGNCDIKVIGHRGTLTHAPENTMYAFHAAYEMGADWVETDVKVTANGTFVLVHDETVDRTTNGTGTVSELSLVYITGLDAGSRFDPSYRDARVPELAELLNWSKEHSGVCPSSFDAGDAHGGCTQDLPARYREQFA